MKKSYLLTLVLIFAALFTTQVAAVAQAPTATAEEAVTALLNRIGGAGAADKFEIVIDENLAENGKDVFVITSQNGKPCIKGNTQLSVATGINWYLNHYAHINLTWNNLTTDLTNVDLPVPTGEEKHVSNATYRYDFNTCTFSYSMAFWTWERWQQEIDWMALHGINAPLNLVGLDVVTRKFLEELGVSESDIDAYIAGPGFIAWFAMNNLEGWGGTINSSSTGVDMSGNPDWWYTRQEQLCKNMLQRMRELGMQPVIPGFSGQVPNCIVNYSIDGFSSGDVVNNGTWAGGYTRPDILKPNTESYRTFAAVYYAKLHEVMGVSELYSMDPFHEGSLPSGVTNATCYPNIMAELDVYHNAVEDATKTLYNVSTGDNQAKWIIQYWQGVPQSGAFSAMSSYGDRFIGLDLFSDNIYAGNAAKWRDTGNNCHYQGRPYIYCMLHNFGGRSGLHGRLETTMDGYFQALANNNNCQGIGATPEGTETNPILYDMLFELPWMDPNSRPTADEWLEDYAYARYGIENDTALVALQNLKKSVWNCEVNQQGTSEAVILARPNWTIGSVSSWSTAAIYWDTQDVRLAADQLISIADLFTDQSADGTANFNYDAIDVVRQAMVDLAAELLPLINAARSNEEEYTRLYQLYLQLMLDLDTMLSYDENFKLERWTSLARNIADEVNGTTENDRNWLEWNARTQVTVWSKGNTDLHDYSNRCWAGLIKDFHYKRWEKFFTTKGGSFDGGWFSGFEYPWTVDFNETYDLAGDYSQIVIPNDMTATEKAVETFGKYFGRVKGATKNFIFPMGVTTDGTKSDVIPEVYRGQTVELPLIIGKDVTVSSVQIDLNGDGAISNTETLTADEMSVAIPADAAIGKTKAIVEFSDGTVITFNLAIVVDITADRTVTAATADANMGTVAIEGTNELTITNMEAVKITATANTGYNFSHWTNLAGDTISNDNPFIYYGEEEATFTANFIQDKWGVPTQTANGLSDATTNNQYVNDISLAYYKREAESIYSVATNGIPTSLFITVPQIIDVPRGASFTISWKDNGTQDLTKCFMSAYMDFNANGDFSEEGELVKVVGTRNADNSAVRSGSMEILLPYDAPLGITHLRMRFDSAWGSEYNSGTGAFNPKGQLDRMCYEIVLNITDKTDKAAHVTVNTNSEEWGTVEVWTDETPDGSTGTEWDVSSNIPLYLRATKSTPDTEFLGWYDHYGRLLTTELEYTMYAREDATYTARFRKFLEIDGWQIEYRTEPGDEVKYYSTTALANGVAPVGGKKYYIAAHTLSGGSYYNRYLYDNGGTLATSTSLPTNCVWTCIDNGDGTFSFKNESGNYLANNNNTNYYISIGATAAKYTFEEPSHEGVTLKNAASYTGGKCMVTKHDGTEFNRYTNKANDGTWSSDYLFYEGIVPDNVIFTEVRKSGDHDLVIPETVEILGEQCPIIGFDNGVFTDNKDLWSISLPATIETMSNNRVFKAAIPGKGADQSADASNYITTDLGTTLAPGEDWAISLTIEDNGNNFNQWGSALIATGNAPMNDTYGNGFQLYMQSTSNGGQLIVKLDENNNNNALASISKGTRYRIDVVYTHSNTQLVVTATSLESQASLAARRVAATRATNSLTLTQDMSSFSTVSHAIPEGVNITNLEVSKGAVPDPFEGCTNLMEMTVDGGNENYYVANRTLYTTSGTDLHELADEEKEEELRALAELIDDTEALIELIATTIDPVGTATEIAMTTTQGNDYYIWCNNPHGDNTGNLENLLDDDANTFFHSNWSSISSSHDYLQVNFGTAAGLDNFKIAGQQRHNATDDRPKNIEIYGSNDNTNWTPIDTVTDLSNSNGATWESDPISVDTRYSYLKFIVKTYNNYNQTNSVSRPYFHMAKFDLFKLTSSAEVAPKYKNLAGITNEETANVYDKLVEALYYYNNGGTAEQLLAAYNVLEPLYTALNAKKDKVFNGVYNINYKDAPIFVAYTDSAVESMSNDVAGYKLFDTTLDGTDAKHQTLQNDAIAAKVAADALFTIVPNSELTGYTISAQGLYMHSTRNQGWAPQLLSADANQAGVYLFEETNNASVYKLKSNRNDIEYVNDWGPIFGNDKSNKENLSTFTLTQVTEYTLNVPEGGFTTLCLPFNVVLPAGVTAYDLTEANLTDEGLFYTYELTTVASEGNTLAKNTPVIIKANAGDYVLTITMDDEGAKASTEGTLLRSGLVKTTIDAGSKYIYDGDNFNIVTTTTNIAANQCWMELGESKGDIIYGESPAFILTTDEANPVLYNIQINRNFNSPAATYLEYNEITGVVNLAAATENDSYQAWYFVAGENGAVQIKPYNGDGKVLGADDNNDGGTKVWAVDKDSKAIDEWTIEQNGEWYNILGNGKCFSNHGGNNSGTMGFYNSKSDSGSQFKFILATFGNNNPRFYQMKDLNANTTAFVGTSVGCYTEESVNILNTAKTNASNIEATGDTSDANSCYNAYKAIRTAKENIIAPDPEKVYYIVSTATNEYCAGKYVHTYREPHIHENATWGNKTYDQKHLLYDAMVDIEPMSLAAFQFEETDIVGQYKMKNLHTGLYVKSFDKNAEHMGTEAEAQLVTISAIANGQVTLKIGNTRPMHAQNDYGVIVTWDASVNNPSTWSINEITDLADLYTIEVPEEGVTTLDLAFNVVLPAGVTAYDIVESDITENVEADRFEYTLTEIATAGDVLAKNTPVIIKATAGEYTFAATMDNENVKGAANNSVLKGSFVKTTIGTDVSNYMLAINDGDIIFQLVEADSTEVVANTAWMELDAEKGRFIYEENSDVIETVMPVAGGVYRIRNFVDNTAEEYKTHYVVNKNLSISLPTSVSEDDKSAMWVCASDTDGNYTFVSALGTVAFGWRGIDEDAIVLTISEGVKPGALTLTKDSNINLAITTEGYNNSGKAALNQYTGNKCQTENASTDWYFEEVTDAGVAFETTIQANYKWATMYLPYTVAIPDGIGAYYATRSDIDGRIINLTPLEDYIPKNTAVLLYREECDTTETYSFTQANELDAVADNLFQGNILKTAIDAASDKIYLLLRYNSREAFYWMADEYDVNCNPGSGYVKCDANKAYFTMPKGPSSASYYSFRYEGTTNIDDKILEEVVADDEAVYDLQGRKVLDTVKGGIYIKAGKKFIAE